MTMTTATTVPSVRMFVRVVVAGLIAMALALSMITATTTPARAATTGTLDGVPIGWSGGGELPWLSDADLARELDVYAAAGGTWLRIDVDWSIIESTKGRYSWSNTDRVVAAAAARGLSVLAILTYTPTWATTAGTTHAPPTSAADYARFAAVAATRYAGRIAAYEIWNEPNNPLFWAPGANVAGYVTLLKAAYPAVKTADPDAIVLGGSLSPGTDGGGWISPVTFTNGMYASGAGPFMDALSVHPYSYPALPSDPTTASWNTFYRVKNLRTIMVNNGDSAKRIWLTEFGAPTGTASSAVTEARQAQIIADGFAFARTLPYAGPLFVYSGRDRGTDTADREQMFGVLHRDFSEKPAMAAVRAAALAPAPATSSPAPAPTTTSPAPTTSSPAPTTTSPAPTTTSPAPTTTSPAPTSSSAAPTTTAPAPATAAPVTPAAPAPVKASSVTTSSAVITWTPGDPGTAAITDYVLQASRNGGPWVSWRHQATTATSTVLTGLRAGSSYTVRVALVSDAGIGAWATTSLRTPRKNLYSVASVTTGDKVVVTRTLTASPRLRQALRHRIVAVVFDPAGPTRAYRLARTTASRLARVSVAVSVRNSGRLTFQYRLGKTLRVVAPVAVHVVPRRFA